MHDESPFHTCFRFAPTCTRIIQAASLPTLIRYFRFFLATTFLGKEVERRGLAWPGLAWSGLAWPGPT